MVNECQTSPQQCIISNAHVILHVSQVASIHDACPSTIVQGTCGLLPVAISLDLLHDGKEKHLYGLPRLISKRCIIRGYSVQKHYVFV